MGYYIRVLGTSDPDIHIDELIAALANDGLSANLYIDESERADNWTIIVVSNPDGEEIMQIERNSVIDGELGKEEIEEFKDDILDYKPLSAARWLEKYLDNVKVIYAFQLLDGSMEDVNYLIVDSIRTVIWNKTGGILQADHEGFSNEEGSHILWQFSDEVAGEWEMAVIAPSGHWSKFAMDLGDKTQREEFWAGDVPQNAKPK